jgi:hypothetical protein
MRSVIMLSVIILTVIRLNIMIFSAIMLSVIMLSVVMVSVVAPWDQCNIRFTTVTYDRSKFSIAGSLQELLLWP